MNPAPILIREILQHSTPPTRDRQMRISITLPCAVESCDRHHSLKAGARAAGGIQQPVQRYACVLSWHCVPKRLTAASVADSSLLCDRCCVALSCEKASSTNKHLTQEWFDAEVPLLTRGGCLAWILREPGAKNLHDFASVRLQLQSSCEIDASRFLRCLA